MTAEIGQLLLILAFLASLYQGVFPLIGARRGDAALMGSARSAAVAQGALVAAAFACLTVLHATSDWSVVNVVQNSHSAKPFVYKLTGVWGNHEGSMLLWSLILAGFGAALALTARSGNALKTVALAVQGLIGAAFLAFILFTSNPFARLFPAPADGRDLNPLLQDPGLAIHPPFLYLGYVGFSIAFAFAVAGLVTGRIDAAWARTVRPWALLAWVFLTIGIALGSWWAYYELGWGGFWAWDPVENASFMPWLVGTAFIHSVRVVEKRGALKVWTVLLAILAFSLSLVGTFLVRSGIITSVHAFAVDPTRGVFILAILVAAVGGSLTLFALRAHRITDEAAFAPLSRESALLANNVILSTAAATVFIGTFYPLFIDVATGARLSVGAPFFNLTFMPLMAILLALMAPGAMLAWKADSAARLRGLWPVAAAAGVLAVIAFAVTFPKAAAAAMGAGLAVWAGGGALYDLARRVKAFEAPFSSLLARIARLPRPYLGMTIAHFGLALIAIGVLGAGVWKSEVIRFMTPGDTVEVGGFAARLEGVERREGPNFIAETARFHIARDGEPVREMTAERRFYPVRRMQTTEAGIWTAWRGDLYLSVGERTSEAGWPVRAYYNPFVVWMWTGAGLLAAGGLVAATRRRPARAPSRAPAETAAAGPARAAESPAL